VYDYKIPRTRTTIFLSDIKSVTDLIEEHRNRFSDKITDLYDLDTNVVMPDIVTHHIRTAEDLSIAQYQTFIKARFNDNVTAFGDTIHRINLPFVKFKSRNDTCEIHFYNLQPTG